MGRLLLKLLLGAAVLFGLADLYRSDRTLFRKPREGVQRYRDRISQELRQRHQLALVFTADDLPGRDWVSGQPVEIAGTEGVAGRIGTALRFDGGRRTVVTFPVRWNELGPSFSLSAWLRLDDRSPDQEILFTREPQPLGLKLDRGHLSFFLSAGEEQMAAQYAFTNYGRYVQVVAVVDGAAGRTRLYEDGVLRAELAAASFETSGARMALGKSSAVLVGEPLQGDVDEVLAWRRALSAEEVAQLAQRDRPAPAWLARHPWRGHQRYGAAQKVIRQSLLMVDRFHPGRHVGPLRRAPLPEVHVILSKSDQKHFTKGHRNCLRSGRRVTRAAAGRAVDLLEGARGFRGRLQLAGSDTAYLPGPRRGYLLEPEAGETVLGLRRLRLLPPESAGWLGPLVETEVGRALGVPVVSNGLCRLLINGELAGLYYYEDASTMGLPPGSESRLFDGRPARTAWRLLATPANPPLAREDLVRLRRDVEDRYRDLLQRDPASPVSGRETEYLLRRDRDRVDGWPLDEAGAALGAARRADLLLTAFAVAGTNPSPLYVLHDLSLPDRLGASVSVTWTSSAPEWIDSAGRVTRPPEGPPRAVTLTATMADGRETVVRSLEFRVMPRQRRVAGIFLWASASLGRLERVDGAVDYYPEGESDVPRRWLAAQDERSGLSLRGNTSLRQLKKPYGVRLAEPHGLWGTTNVCKINLVNPWRDGTLLRNRLCYDLFRRFGGPGRHDGLPITWAEVFVNGHYRGLYEANPPVRAEWLGLAPFERGQESPAVVYKAQRTAPSLQEQRLMRQIEPSRRHGVWAEPAIELQRFLEAADTPRFVREAAQWLDLDNLLDFHLLIDLSENYNGWPFLYPIHDVLARDAGADARFFLVPYDFDTTWDPRPVGFYHSQVFTRLMREYPGYRDRLAARWRELRTGPLRLDDITAQVHEHQALLAGYVAWDDRRWERDPADTYERRVEQLLGQIRLRVAQLDKRFGYKARDPSPDPEGL